MKEVFSLKKTPWSLKWCSFVIVCIFALNITSEKNAGADNTPTTIVVHPNTPPTPAQLEHRAKLWQEALTQVTKKEKTPIVVKINLTDQIFNTHYLIPSGSLAMETLQRAAKLRWEQIDGVQVFHREWKPNVEENKLVVAAWINSLSQEQQEALFKTGIPFSSANKKLQGAALDLLNRPDIPVGANLPFAFLDNRHKSRIFLRFLPRFQFTSVGRNKPGSMIAGDLRETEKSFGLSNHSEQNAEIEFPPLLPPSPSALLTFENEILALDKIIERASIIFNSTYPRDAEHSEKMFFVSGSMDKAVFEKVLSALKSHNQMPSSIRSFTTEEKFLSQLYTHLLKNEYGNLIDSEVSVGWAYPIPQPFDKEHMPPGMNPGLMPNSETVLMKDFVEGLDTTMRQLTQDKPGLRSFFSAIGLSLETPISLSISLTFFVAAHGVHPIGESNATMDGKPVLVIEDNIGSFNLFERHAFSHSGNLN